MSYSEAKATLEAAGFQVQVARPAVNAFPVPYGYVASQSPSGRAVAGSTITLYISNGQPPGTTPPPSPKPKPCKPPKPGCPPPPP